MPTGGSSWAQGNNEPSQNTWSWMGKDYASSDPNFLFPGQTNSPFGQGPEGLKGIVSKYLYPELERLQGGRSGIESALLEQTLEPGALFGAASEAAGGYAQELFKPGGEVASLISRARGRRIGQGFNAADAAGPENAILGGATDSVSNFFAQRAAELEGARYGGLQNLYSGRQQGIRELLTSLYTGQAGAEQLQLAQDS